MNNIWYLILWIHLLCLTVEYIRNKQRHFRRLMHKTKKLFATTWHNSILFRVWEYYDQERATLPFWEEENSSLLLFFSLLTDNSSSQPRMRFLLGRLTTRCAKDWTKAFESTLLRAWKSSWIRFIARVTLNAFLCLYTLLVEKEDSCSGALWKRLKGFWNTLNLLLFFECHWTTISFSNLCLKNAPWSRCLLTKKKMMRQAGDHVMMMLLMMVSNFFCVTDFLFEEIISGLEM